MENEFSVSWVTPGNVKGHVIYGTDPSDLNMIARDDRGKDYLSDTHHVRIGDQFDTVESYGVNTSENALVPGTTYYFKIVSNGEEYGEGDTNFGGAPLLGGTPWNITTASTPSYEEFQLVMGLVIGTDGESKVRNALIYLTIIEKSTGIASAPLSIVTWNDGTFGIDISDARYENGSMFKWNLGDGLNVIAHAGSKGSGVNDTDEVKRGRPDWPFQGFIRVYLQSNQQPTVNILLPSDKGGVANMSFTTRWDVYDFDDDAIINVYYDTDEIPGDETEIASNISEESKSNELTFDTSQFATDSTFYVKIEALDGFNPPVELYSTPITIDRTPPSAITDLSAQPGTNNGEVMLAWTAPGDDGDTGQASGYVARYSSLPINSSNWNSALEFVNDIIPKESGELENLVITGLEGGQLYYFAVKTSDGASLSRGSNIASSLSQLDMGPPAKIEGLKAETGDETGEVNLQWIATGDDGDVGKASAYIIKYNKTLISNANWEDSYEIENPPVPNISTTSEFFTVTNLDPDERYFFAIIALDEGSNPSVLSDSAHAVAKLDKEDPGAIIDLKAQTGHDNGEVVLTWTAPGDDGSNGKTSVYILKYATIKITDANWGDATILENFTEPELAGIQQNFTVKGLNPGTVYYFAIKSMDESPNLSPVSNSPSTMAYSDATFLKIDSPKEGEVYLTTDIIIFDASNTTDVDDVLSFLWTSNITGGLGEKAKHATNLSAGNHMITIFVGDEKGGFVRGKVNITVITPSNQSQGIPVESQPEDFPLSNAQMFTLSLFIIVTAVALYDVQLYFRYIKGKTSRKKTH